MIASVAADFHAKMIDFKSGNMLFDQEDGFWESNLLSTNPNTYRAELTTGSEVQSACFFSSNHYYLSVLLSLLNCLHNQNLLCILYIKNTTILL